MIGRSIAHYQITAQLGVGGMGEVYRATDSRLNRDVAVKVMPDSVAADADRLARFQREAQLLAALNHPNIAQIYGIEDHDGHQAIILELVEGETLAERIDRGAIPFDEARKLALQITEALEVAHEKGIIHRDLKPANIKITPEGTVKVLDFGLAKALAPELPDSNMSLSPTMTAAATQAGMIMGTAAYMSPEQARGRPVDRRADVWAFGCVLYEMLVAGKPFAGTDVSEVMAHIITKDPDLSRLPPRLPASIEDLIRRCLRKDLRLRLPDIGVARIALHEATEEEAAILDGDASPTASSRLPVALAAVIGLGLGLLAGWGFLARPPAPASSSATHFELVLDPPPAHWAMALSSDGGSVIYSGQREGERQLYERDLGSYASRTLPETEGGHWPLLSPDGQKLAFLAAGRLKTINLNGGGLPEQVCGVPGGLLGAVWTADNRIIYSTNVTVVPQQVNAGGGEPEPVSIIDLEDGAQVVMPRPLPGGRAILATLVAPSQDGPRVVALDLETGDLKTLARGQDAMFVKPETLLYVQRDRVMVAPFDPRTRELTGPERQASIETPAVSTSTADERFTRFRAAASPNGTFLYPAGRFGLSNRTYWLDRDGEVLPTGLEGAVPQLDSTGRYAAVELNNNVWLLDLQEGFTTQVTFNGTSAYPMWSADDKKIIFGDRRRTGTYLPYELTADGHGEMRPLVDESALEDIPSPNPTSRFPDGRLLIYGVHPRTNRDIWALHPDGTLEPVLRTEANERAGTISRDGKLLAYVSDEEGSDEVYVRELPDIGRRWRVSRGGGMSPVWSHDGRELFFRTGDTIMASTVDRDGGLRVGEPQALFTNHRLHLDLWGNKTFDAAPDGRLLISMRDPDDVRTRIVLNWDPQAAASLANVP